ncbi:zinc-binding dehydrogenase [Paenibacillus sp. GCM10023252]|uniref:zinc-binding dehydrogenase n=1 Tax=Paenibacillus sp. GCM10023252 TaxID=3252649 RepID=UPI003609669C
MEILSNIMMEWGILVQGTMKAVRLNGYGGASDLELVETDIPQLAPGEVLIKVLASSINPSDLLFLEGKYGVKLPLPCLAGVEGSGLVVAAGSGFAARRLKGKRVTFASQNCGAWAEYVNVSALGCIVLPDNVSDEQGAVFFVNPASAYALLSITKKSRVKAVVHTAGASALGKVLIQLAKGMGITVISIVRREEQAETLKQLGEQHVLVSTAAGFDEELQVRCAELGAAVCFDAVGGELAGRVLTAMPDGSTLYQYGLLSGEKTTADAEDLVFHRKSIQGFWMSDWVKSQSILKLLAMQSTLTKLIGSSIQTDIHRRFPLEEAAEAAHYYSSHMSAGKVLLVPGK